MIAAKAGAVGTQMRTGICNINHNNTHILRGSHAKTSFYVNSITYSIEIKSQDVFFRNIREICSTVFLKPTIAENSHSKFSNTAIFVRG